MKQQNQLSDINTILEALQSVVKKSFLSPSESKSPEEIHFAASFFPVISCFANVIKFVNEGLVNIPQDTVKQFLEVAEILQIVKVEDIHHEEADVDDEDSDEDVLCK